MSELFAEADFPVTGEAEWRRLAEMALAGEPFDTLVSRTEDGTFYGPIHARHAPVRPILRRESATPWRIVQRVDDPDPERANAQALADLDGGANALSLVFEGAPSAHCFGLPLTDAAIRKALDGVMLDMVHLRIEPHPNMEAAVTAIRRVVVERAGAGFEGLDIDHGLDPVGCFAASGRLPTVGEDRLRDRLHEYQKRLFDESCLVEADGRVYHEAGATEAQELGAVLATALHYLRIVEDDVHDLPAFLHRIGFTLAVDQKQFVSMAKIRALRLLWARLLLECGVDSRDHAIRIHAETSFRMMSAKDPHTNIVRTTVAAFAAATGGADSLSVLPFTIANGLPEAKARRLARNVQTILQDESGLASVCDPAAGSGGIEALTEGLARAAWDEFRRIEAEGGIFASLRSSALQARIAAARQMRQKGLAERRGAVIGATLYPLETERDVAVLVSRRLASTIEPPDGGDVCEPLRPHRLTEELEAAT